MRILLPLDGTMNPQILDFFAQMQSPSEVTVAMMHVLSPSLDGHGETALAAKAALAEAAHRVRVVGPTVVECLCEGNPAQEIVEMGRQLDVDLIAMFASAKSRYVRGQRGGVMDEVLNAADRPVIAINHNAASSARGVFGRVAFSMTPNHALAASGAR